MTLHVYPEDIDVEISMNFLRTITVTIDRWLGQSGDEDLELSTDYHFPPMLAEPIVHENIWRHDRTTDEWSKSAPDTAFGLIRSLRQDDAMGRNRVNPVTVQKLIGYLTNGTADSPD
jgi:hypothetical protein